MAEVVTVDRNFLLVETKKQLDSHNVGDQEILKALKFCNSESREQVATMKKLDRERLDECLHRLRVCEGTLLSLQSHWDVIKESALRIQDEVRGQK